LPASVPARASVATPKILAYKLHATSVRTFTLPQSRHFLDACDELACWVLEEIPGWQHIGDQPWKRYLPDNVGRMIPP